MQGGVVALARSDIGTDRSAYASHRGRLGPVLPLCLVVAVAIVCVVVAVLSSAHRTDVVALEQERELFRRAFVNRSEWSLRKLDTIANAVDELDHRVLFDSTWVQRRIGMWLKSL